MKAAAARGGCLENSTDYTQQIERSGSALKPAGPARTACTVARATYSRLRLVALKPLVARIT